MKPRLRAALASVVLLASSLAAQQPPPVAPPPQFAPYTPFVEPASPEAAAYKAQIKLAPGLDLSLWAAEPLLANPICISIDEQGDLYVGESFRIHKGVFDIRDTMDWLDDDLSSETVADRVAMYRKHLGADFDSTSKEHDRVRLVRDTDGDGIADTASVFADDFSLPETGLGAGLLARRMPDGSRDVFFTDIPDLWHLRDTDGDGHADHEESLSNGWGVRVAFMGHDMHGLRIGPDGRLYWSIGDRGFSVTTKEGELLHYPYTGAVLRCELDGSHLQVVHIGLRNPQELAFDDRGDLFTGDNNCDAGDQARLVPIVEGGDSGWRQPVQWLDDRGPWGREKLWAPRFDGQAAYLIPPIANLASGPSGFTHEPGTALPAFAHDFLLCDFTGGADSSHIWAFPVESDGAFFKLGEVKDFESGLLATDCDFGPDGALYVSDWVEGWSGCNKGRIWRVTDPTQQKDPLVAETKALIGGDWSKRSIGELETLLGHADQRVRTAAEFELVQRGVPGLDALEHAAKYGAGLARLHGIWGIGIAGRRSAREYERLAGLAMDPDPEVRAQVFTTLDLPTAGTLPSWIAKALSGVDDSEPRVAARAALAIGRLHDKRAGDHLLFMTRHSAYAKTDPVLRHAIAMGLAATQTQFDLWNETRDSDEPDRLIAVLALRQLAAPSLAAFLHDPSLRVELEAARAIHDLPVPEALPDLAACVSVLLPDTAEDGGLPLAKDGGPAPHDNADAFVRRVLAANDRVGEPDNARALAVFAARADQRVAHRRFALDMLADWAHSPRRDRILGFELPVCDRDTTPLPGLAHDLLAAGLDHADDSLATGWVHVAASSGAADLAPALAAIVDDAARNLDLRVEALHALATLAPPDLPAIVDRTLGARESRLRAAALTALEQLSPEQAVPRVLPLLGTGELPERRVAYQILGRAAPGVADTTLGSELDRLQLELVPVELRLDLLLAAQARGGALAQRIADRHATRLAALMAADLTPASADGDAPAPVAPALEPYLDGLFGGDRDKGHAVFNRPALSCTKCHATDDYGKQVVGPNLQGVGKRLARLNLVESIVAPNRRIAPGFGNELLFLKGGESLACRVLEEDKAAGTLKVTDKDGNLRILQAADIEVRKPSLSPMPEGLAASIPPEDMRDLVEYLAGL